MKETVGITRQKLPDRTGFEHDKVGTVRGGAGKDDLRKAAEEFEAIFLETVLKSMRKSVGKSGFMDGGHAEELYESMLDGEYAKSMAGNSQTGLASLIEGQLRKISDAQAQGSVARHREALRKYQEPLTKGIPSLLKPEDR